MHKLDASVIEVSSCNPVSLTDDITRALQNEPVIPVRSLQVGLTQFMFYETMKKTMSLLIVETLHFNHCQRVVHEGVSGHVAISQILTTDGVRIKVMVTTVLQLWKKLILMEIYEIFAGKRIAF